MDKLYSVYIMTNKNNTVLYTGVTNNLKRRVYEHREKRVEGFTKKYNVTKLVIARVSACHCEGFFPKQSVYYEILRDVKTPYRRRSKLRVAQGLKK